MRFLRLGCFCDLSFDLLLLRCLLDFPLRMFLNLRLFLFLAPGAKRPPREAATDARDLERTRLKIPATSPPNNANKKGFLLRALSVTFKEILRLPGLLVLFKS